MNSLNNLPKEKVDELLKAAGKSLNTDPQKLKSQLESGALNDVLKNVNNAQAEKINQMLNNPKALEMLLNTPQAKELLKKLMGGK